MSITSSSGDSHKDPAVLEREVDQVRARLGQTVDALGDKLSPGEIIDQALGLAREHGGDFGRNLGAQVKNNPVPLILTGIGLTWLMSASKSGTTVESRYSSGSSSSDYTAERQFRDGKSGTATSSGSAKDGVGSRIKDGLSGAKNSITESAHDAKDSVSSHLGSTRDSLQGFAADAQQSVRARATDLQHGFEDMMVEQPLLVGALGIALGAALGAALPATESENKFMGSTRDEVVDRGRQAAAQQYEKGREAVKETAEQIKTAVRDETGNSGSATSGHAPANR